MAKAIKKFYNIEFVFISVKREINIELTDAQIAKVRAFASSENLNIMLGDNRENWKQIDFFSSSWSVNLNHLLAIIITKIDKPKEKQFIRNSIDE